MKQQPDKIFHEKLNDFHMPVPPSAWDRIEADLDKKKRKFPWLSIAASVTVVALSLAAVYKLGEEPEKISMKTNEEVTPKEKIDTAPTVELNGAVSKVESISEKEVKRDDRKVASSMKIQKKVSTMPGEEEQRDVALPEVEMVIPDSIPSSYPEPLQLAFRSIEKTENVTIVLSAEETAEYLLVKNTSTTEATSDDDKASTLRKLLRKAADLKVNQDPLGELRQKKNEILALNFRSEKQRGQKK